MTIWGALIPGMVGFVVSFWLSTRREPRPSPLDCILGGIGASFLTAILMSVLREIGS